MFEFHSRLRQLTFQRAELVGLSLAGLFYEGRRLLDRLSIQEISPDKSNHQDVSILPKRHERRTEVCSKVENDSTSWKHQVLRRATWESSTLFTFIYIAF